MYSGDKQQSMESRHGGIIGDMSDLVAFFNKHKDSLDRVLPLAEKALSFASRLIDALEENKLFRWFTGIKP